MNKVSIYRKDQNLKIIASTGDGQSMGKHFIICTQLCPKDTINKHR